MRLLAQILSLRVLSLLAVAQTSAPSPDWHAAIARGVELFWAGRYARAVTAFERAAALRPGDPVPHLYTGLAWKQQFIPGADLRYAPAISAIGAHAEQEFRRALELDPQNWPALVLLGQLSLDRNRLDEARALYKEALHLDPATADIWCITRRSRLPDGTLGPPQDASVLQQLKASVSPIIEQGMSNLTHALSLNPRRLTAMQWLDLLFSLRASVRQNPTDLARAEEWRRKAQDIQEEQNRRGASGVIVSWSAALAWHVPRIARFCIVHCPAIATTSASPASRCERHEQCGPRRPRCFLGFRHVPSEDGPPPLLVNLAAAERNLVNKVEPVYPEAATPLHSGSRAH